MLLFKILIRPNSLKRSVLMGYFILFDEEILNKLLFMLFYYKVYYIILFVQ